MGGYEPIGTWQVSLDLAPEVREQFRGQIATVLNGEMTDALAPVMAHAGASYIEVLLCGGSSFVPPDPFAEILSYFRGTPQDRYEQTRSTIERMLYEVTAGGKRDSIWWRGLASQVQGDEFITPVHYLVSPQNGEPSPALIRINYKNRHAYIEPATNNLQNIPS